jgi:hypothetical protein
MKRNHPDEIKSFHPNTSSNLTPNQQEGNRKQRLKKDTTENDVKQSSCPFPIAIQPLIHQKSENKGNTRKVKTSQWSHGERRMKKPAT